MVVLDQWGLIFAQMFRPPSAGTSPTFNVNETTGSLRTFRFWGNHSGLLYMFRGGRNKAQVGKGVSIVTRQDFGIENPFTNGGVEDGAVNSAFGGYNNALGRLQFSTQITPTGGSGSVTEVIKITGFSDSGGTVRELAMFRDVVSPVAFISGETITVTHEVVICLKIYKFYST